VRWYHEKIVTAIERRNEKSAFKNIESHLMRIVEMTNKSDYHTSKVYTSSMQRNVPNLREVMPFPRLHIHPDTTSERKIENDDWIIVESPHGWMKVKAEIYPGIRPNTVMILHGWWQGCKELGFGDFPLFDGGANVNIMYSVDPEKAFDPIITAYASQTLVQIRKAVS
jgi:anaerobic selenocysteine-containing dehydrogenase